MASSEFWLVLLLLFVVSSVEVDGDSLGAEFDVPEVRRLRQYLKINTAQPYPDYLEAIKFLIYQAQAIGLQSKILEYAQAKPLVLISWRGRDPELASVMFNSHTDVVSAEPSKWIHPPFDAHVDDDGNIYARGSQDMKSIGMMYLEAARRLIKAGFIPLRSIHFTYVPDEEVGGAEGTESFVQSNDFEELNVGVLVDEGMPSETDEYRVFNKEKISWAFVIKATGETGHGSRMVEGTAAFNLQGALDRIAEFRAEQRNAVKLGTAKEVDVVSVNNVYIKAGIPSPTEFVMNMQPSEAEAGFDMRFPPDVDPDVIENMIRQEWAPASQNLSVKFINKQPARDKNGEPFITPATDSNPWWWLLRDTISRAGEKLGQPETRVGASDARFYRRKGIIAFGFSPIANTPNLMHGNNEFLNVKEYIKGVKLYEEIIKSFSGPHDVNGNLDVCKAFMSTLYKEGPYAQEPHLSL